MRESKKRRPNDFWLVERVGPVYERFLRAEIEWREGMRELALNPDDASDVKDWNYYLRRHKRVHRGAKVREHPLIEAAGSGILDITVDDIRAMRGDG